MSHRKHIIINEPTLGPYMIAKEKQVQIHDNFMTMILLRKGPSLYYSILRPALQTFAPGLSGSLQFGIKGPLWSIWWPAMFSIASSWFRQTPDARHKV